MTIFNKKALKQIFKKQGFKISNKTLEDFLKIHENKILKEINKITRETQLSGRKVIRKEDFK